MKALSPKVDCIVDARCECAESPVWDGRTLTLWWANIHAPSLNRYDPASGDNVAYALPAPLGSFAPREKDGFVVALKSGLHFFEPPTGRLDFIAHPFRHLPGHRMNDGRCDRAGRFFVGTMKEPIEPAEATSSFYRLDPGGRLATLIDGGIIVANGLAFSPDNRILYRSDSHRTRRTVWAYDLAPDGSISNRRVFVDTHGLAGRPDGGCVDADGCYWMAAIDSWSLMRFTPAGKLDMQVNIPVECPTMPCFGGKDLKTLYFTSLRRPGNDDARQPQAGSVFVTAVPGVQGLPEPRFRG